MIRLNDKLSISERQKLELNNMLFSFLKSMNKEEQVSKMSSEFLFNTWNKKTDKPQWIKERLNSGAGFIAEICNFFDKYKGDIENYEALKLVVNEHHRGNMVEKYIKQSK